MHHFPTCRFCKEVAITPQSTVHYGRRHHAHFACYLDAGKKLEALTDWQIGTFPFYLIKERGLEAIAEAAAEREARYAAMMQARRDALRAPAA